MIIAGSSYCHKNVLSRLEIGSYIEVAAEPDNPYDKDAVMLLYDGERIGYIAKKDKRMNGGRIINGAFKTESENRNLVQRFPKLHTQVAIANCVF